MIALVLAALLLGSAAVAVKNRRNPEKKPIRVEVEDRRSRPRR